MDKTIAIKRGSIKAALSGLRTGIMALFAVLWAGAGAFAAETGELQMGQPIDWQLSWQEAATKIAEQVQWFEGYSLMFIVPVTGMILLLLLWCIVMYRKSVNPVASRTSHNTMIEVIWTIGPVIILLFLAIPSFQLLTAQYSPEDPQITVKATGYQWYWGYEYQVDDPLSFDSLLLQDSDRAALGKEDLAVYPRLLTVDNELVVPVNATVRLLVTAADVIHSWTIPAFGVKMDAVPGRLNEAWFKADREGLYYGQCSELCGKDHAFMPIGVRVVSQEQYDTWLAAAREDMEGANKALLVSINDFRNVTVAGN